MNTIDNLIELARSVADGTVSHKTETTLQITAAGTEPNTLDRSRFIELSRNALDSLSHRLGKEHTLSELLYELRDIETGLLPPGNDTFVHNTIGARYVVASSAPPLAAIVASNHGERFVDDHFGSEAIWVPLTLPGVDSTRTLRERIAAFASRRSGEPSLIFLANYGVLVGGDTIEELRSRIENTIQTAEIYLSHLDTDEVRQVDSDRLIGLSDAVRRAIADIWAINGSALSPPISQACADAEILRRSRKHDLFAAVSKPLITDHLVHLGRSICFVPRFSDLTSPQALLADVLHSVHEFHAQWNASPRVIVIENAGAVIIGDEEGELRRSCRSFSHLLETAYYADQLGGVSAIPDRFIESIVAEDEGGEGVGDERADEGAVGDEGDA